jgi:TolB-like protein/Tfp pilus assembly protein PilF
VGDEAANPATAPLGAVFLSYASQDAEAAGRICDALRAAGIEVWFDRTELRGGDAWDRKIQDQIHACRLFIPIISANTEQRDEGYFRREWRLAVERAGDMAEQKAFLLPVVIDSTSERGAFVPDKFRHLQWTRLPRGETPTQYVAHIEQLLSPQRPSAQTSGSSVGASMSKVTSAVGTPFLRPQRALVAVAAAMVVGVVAYVVVDKFSKPSGPTPTVVPAPGGTAPAALSPSPQSIAVLPLANESGDAKEQYFSDGISEDLITALSQLPGLKVIGRSSSFQFRDSTEDSRSIGSKLGVAHLLEGSVRHAGDVVRVSAELINAADGSTQWSERYDRPYEDLFALQDEITRAVAGALRMKLLPGEQAASQSERPPGGSLEAYNALLQGRFYNSRGTEVDQRKAIEYFKQAVELDPRYALALSELSSAWTALGEEFVLEGAPRQEVYAKARETVDLALALSPELAQAHLARGYLLQIADLNWRVAEAEFRRAMELAPNDADAKFFLGTQLAAFGEVEAAIGLTRQALATEPLKSDSYFYLSSYLSGMNRLDEAEQAIRRAIELQPAAAVWHWQLAVIEVQRGNAQAALAAAQQETGTVQRDTALAVARQIGSDRTTADAALQVLVDKHASSSAFEIAEVYALRNQPKETFEWLDRAWTNRESDIAYLLFDPFILRFKDEPRFAAFCRKVGLPTPAEIGHRT